MRWLAGLVLKLALAWCIWWVAATFAVQAGLSAGLSRLDAQGWRAEADVGGLAGFPGRIVLPLTGLALAAPEGAPRLAAPGARLSAPTWNPFRLEAAWPGARLSLPSGRGPVELSTAAGSARLAVAPGLSLVLDSAALSLDDLEGGAPWLAAAEALEVAVERTAGARHDLRLRAEGLAPAPPLRALLDPEGRLPAALDTVELAAVVTLDRPLPLRDPRASRLAALDLEALEIVWGAVDVSASGAITVDADGLPEGTLMLRSTAWRELLSLAVAAGVLDAESAGTAEGALSFLALGGALTVPLIFSEGMVALGPVPLGAAPRLPPPQRQ